MEPSEFDQIVRSKLQEENSLHHREIEASKPFVWAAIQSNKTAVLPWYYLVAAALLFFLCSSFLFFNLQQQHQSEMESLAAKVELLKNRTDGVEIVAHKNQQLDLLCAEVEALEHSLARAKPNPPVISNQVVYQTDTVFITQTEYITQYLPPTSDTIQKEEKIAAQQPEGNSKVDLNTTSELIYPDFNPSTNPPSTAKENTSVKVKINAFPTN